MSAEDRLILQLLYHPQITCGMNAEQCTVTVEKLLARQVLLDKVLQQFAVMFGVFC